MDAKDEKDMFTPVETTVGALLLHQATSNLLYQNGNILGLSGYLRQLLSAPTKEQIAFFTGMAASYVPLKALAPQLMAVYPMVQLSPKTAMATSAVGALIGWGTKVISLCLDKLFKRLTWLIRWPTAVLLDTCFVVFLG